MPRPLVTLLMIVGLLFPFIPASAQPTDWPSGTPEEHGLDSNAVADMLLSLQKDVPGLHSVLVLRDGEVIVDASFYPYDGSTPHEMASVTKSVMTTLIGIAADRGFLRLDQPMVSFFPGREIANLDARKEAVTVADLASMTSGLDCTWQPDEPTLAQMVATDDWVGFALNRPMVADPGTRWEYCSPDMHLLSAILTEATGMTALDFGWRYLFGPLGMREVNWPADHQDGWGDIYLFPRDAAKLGQLWLDGGKWNGQQVVSQEWVTMSVTPVSRTPDDEDDYGYGWWVEHESEVGGEFRAVGRSGQHIVVYPALGVMVVTTGGGTFDSGDVTDRLGATVVDLEAPGGIPANPEGVARLNEVVAGLLKPPSAQPVAPLPVMAATVSGVTYTFPDNPLEIASIHVVFDGSDEAVLELGLEDGRVVTGPVGLDGDYRFTSYDYGFPLALRGMWVDEDTFQFEWNEIANRDVYLLELTFTSDAVSIEAREITHHAGVQVKGDAVAPAASPLASPVATSS